MTQTQSDDLVTRLLPCPFCGGEAYPAPVGNGIWCKSCEVEMHDGKDGIPRTVPTEAAAEIQRLQAQVRQMRRIAGAVEIRMRTATDHTRAGKDHIKVRIADWHVLMNIGMNEIPAALASIEGAAG